MSDTEDVPMDDAPALDKGKGPALDAPGQSAAFGDDNLPWCAAPAAPSHGKR
jgi:hypothetical protein